MMEEEVWKDINFIDTDGRHWDLTGRYQVSNMGRVRNIKTGNILKGSYCGKKKKYIQHNFKINGITKQFKTHRLVAHMFVYNSNPKEKICVNHINENRHDNRAENLEWCTYMENNHHKDRIERIAEIRRNNPYHFTQEHKDKISCKVVGINLETGEIIRFNSCKDASEFLGLKGSEMISRNCKGRVEQVRGYKWYYEKDFK